MVNLYIFNESNRAAIYGIGTYIKELTAALKVSSVNINIVHLHSENTEEELPEPDNVRHIHIPPSDIRNSSLDLKKQNELYYRNVVYLLRMKVKDFENPVFHLNNNHNGKLAEELKRTFDCKIAATIHYLDWCFILFGNITRFKKIWKIQENEQLDKLKKTIDELYRKDKDFFAIIDHIICLSENTQQILQNYYKVEPKKTTVIYNGISDKKSGLRRKELLRKYGMPDSPIILFVGRLDEIKGLIYALRAFKIVLHTLPHCRFIIAGNGTFDIHLIECEDIWTNVIWTGFISKEKLYDLYSIADIGVMPSFHEQCSYVAIEMMMHGLPIIGSTTTGLKEMIEDGETGLHIHVIEQDESVEIDTSLLAEKILYLLQHPLEAKKMGQNGRKRFLKKYSSEVFHRNMMQFYDSLMK